MTVPTAFSFLKSTRSLSVVIVVTALSVALFMGRVSADQYITIASVVVTAYFAKRDEKKELEEDIADRLNKK